MVMTLVHIFFFRETACRYWLTVSPIRLVANSKLNFVSAKQLLDVADASRSQRLFYLSSFTI